MAASSPKGGDSVSGGPAWPAEAEADYEKVRPLGRGAFGTVWMARSKAPKEKKPEPSSPSPSPEEEEPPKEQPADQGEERLYVAIKSIRTVTESEKAYARREYDILSELRHPNVHSLIRTYDSPSGNYVLCVLGLAHGPNLGALIGAGGALGLPLARLASRHLVAAVGYLHGRGVVHRDVKPDNCVLVRQWADRSGGGGGASPEKITVQDVLDDDAIWSDGPDGEEAVRWDRYKLILVDFGFARALGPDDVGGGDGNKSGEDAAATTTMTPPPLGGDPRRYKRGSVARVMVKGMSALGTRAFAAPEVKDGAHDKKTTTAESSSGGGAGAGALTEAVSDYGMVSDAYSVGVTLKEVLTGVPADVADIAAYISARDNFAANALSSLCACGGKKTKGGDGADKKSPPRKKRYRHVHQVPRDAASMVRDMTRGKSEDRLTVREAQDHPWIAGDAKKGEDPYEIPRGDVPSRHGDPIVFLRCAGGTGVEAAAKEDLEVLREEE